MPGIEAVLAMALSKVLGSTGECPVSYELVGCLVWGNSIQWKILVVGKRGGEETEADGLPQALWNYFNILTVITPLLHLDVNSQYTHLTNSPCV